MKVTRGLLAGVILTFAVPVCAQSLGDLAKKEQERRKTTPPAAKVYTNDDLKKIYVPGAVTAPPAADQPSKPGDPAAKGEDAKGDAAKGDAAKTGDAKSDEKPDLKKDEAAWRARMTAARDALNRFEMFRAALQSQINGLTTDFTSRDDPAQRAQIADQRQKAIAELAQVGKDIESAKKHIADIEEEARQKNVPPGWIR